MFHNLKKVLQGKKLGTNVGDEGGFAPDLPSNAAALDVIVEAIDKAGYKAGKQVFIALDLAASEFYDAEKKRYTVDGKEIDAGRHGRSVLASWVDKYPICSIEDGCAEDDWDGWKLITERLGDQDAAGRRRHVRHQHEAAAARHRRGRGQQHPDQGEPDRHADRNDRGRLNWPGATATRP